MIILATRNVSDFGGTGIEIIDPWLQSPGEQPAGQLRRAVFSD